jgi:dihydrofolate synthase/folylpolyglutamate synthase
MMSETRTPAVTYRDVLARLVVARRFGMRLGLDRMRDLLDRLGAQDGRGAPDRRLGTVVHVGGTNGKGSTVAMIAALAVSGGARVATYTSPHLSTLRERIVIEESNTARMVSEEAFVAAAARVEAARGGELTFFEQVTAIAMLIIADANVDITVLEVGLGGRLDATNVVPADVIGCVCLTGVAMDHQAILGDTLDAIAFEKAGICKPDTPVVIGTSGEPAGMKLLERHARATGAARIILLDDDEAVLPAVALPGDHQQRNAQIAIAAMKELGRPFDAAALQRVAHPGRFEEAGDLILDGAHNPHGARALAATLRARGVTPVLVLAISADKDATAIAEALVPEVRAVVATRYQQERALDPEALARELREVGGVRVETAPELEAAVARARQLGDRVLVAGSLFLVGEARTRFLGAPSDPFVATELVAAVT